MPALAAGGGPKEKMNRVPRRYATRLSTCNNGQILAPFLRLKKGPNPLQFRVCSATRVDDDEFGSDRAGVRVGQIRSVPQRLGNPPPFAGGRQTDRRSAPA